MQLTFHERWGDFADSNVSVLINTAERERERVHGGLYGYTISSAEQTVREEYMFSLVAE